MDESFCSVRCEGGSDLCNITEVVEGRFDSVADVGFKGEGGIKDYAKVAGLGGGGDRGAVDSECGGVGEFTEGGFGANEEEFSFVAVKFQEVILHPESE